MAGSVSHGCEGYSPIQTGHLLILLSIGMSAGAPSRPAFRPSVSSSQEVVLWDEPLLSEPFPPCGVLEFRDAFWYGLVSFPSVFSTALNRGLLPCEGTLSYSHIRNRHVAAQFLYRGWSGSLHAGSGRIIQFFPRINQAYPVKAYNLCFLLCFLHDGCSLVFLWVSGKRR